MFIHSSTHESFQASCQISASQQNSPAAAQALQSDVGPQTDHFPFVTSAWMRLSQADDVAKSEIGEHILIIIPFSTYGPSNARGMNGCE